MNGTIIAIIGVGVGLGGLTATLGGLILKGQGRLATAIESNRRDIAGLRERMARLEGLFEGHLDRPDAR